MELTNVVIAGVGSAGTGREIMKAFKMVKGKYKIIATDMNNKSLGIHDTPNRYVIPPAKSNEYINALLKICKKENASVLVPGSDKELEKISENRKKFEDEGIIVLINSKDVIQKCSDKFELINFLNKKGIICPKHSLYNNEKDVEEINYFPIIIKPKSGGGSKNVFFAQDKDEAKFFCKYLIKYGLEPIIEEHIGNYQEEYTVGILYADNGKLLTSIAMKRLLTGGLSTRQSIVNPNTNEKYVISSGISQGIVEDFGEVRKMGEKIAKIIEADGPINIQCRKTENGIIPFEINPRFSGTTGGRALLGHNEPDILCQYRLFGKIPEKIEYKFGYVIRDLTEKFIGFKEIEEIPKI
jgi:carbamoyl-phosphate synthase large subunit